MDLCGETQSTTLDCETQVLDELLDHQNVDTQLLDECSTEAVVESDSQESDRTEVLEFTEVVSDDNTEKGDGKHLLKQEKVMDNAICDGVDGKIKLQSESKEECSLGSPDKGFTSVRVASLRASGLAAQCMASKENNAASYLMINNRESMNPPTSDHQQLHAIGDSSEHLEKVDNRFTSDGLNGHMNHGRGENRYRVGSSTARKLFTDDINCEMPDGQINMGNVVEDLLPCDTENELAGLSYVDSQEPGDLSQAIALDIVDKFLAFNAIDFDKEIDLEMCNGGNFQSSTSTKGTQRLAKRSSSRNASAERGIFDWDDSREDEGGGEFFQRKKEIFFSDRGHKKRFSAPSKRSTCSVNKDKKSTSDFMNQEQNNHHTKGHLVCSDSRMLACNKKGDERLTKTTITNFGKKLVEEFDEVLDTSSTDGKVTTPPNADDLDMLNIGADTQVAAEAMEELCLGVGMTDHSNNDANQDTEGNRKNFSKRGTHHKANVTRDSRLCERQLKETNSGTSLRKGSLKQLKNKRQFDHEILEGLKKTKSDVKQQSKRKQRKRGVPGKGDIDETNELNVAVSTGQTSTKRQHLQDKLNFVSPIACRTRQKMTAHGSDGCKEKKIGQEKVGKKILGSASVADTHLDYPKTRRSGRKLSSIMQEGDGKISARIKRSRSEVLHVSEDVGVDKIAQPFVCAHQALTSSDSQTERAQQGTAAVVSGDCNIPRSTIEMTPKDGCKLSASACKTPDDCKTPANGASPVCISDEYLKQSCRKNVRRPSLMKEINSLISTSPLSTSAVKNSRKRKGIASVHVLFSHHLDEDIIKQQRKIMQRLGASEASSVSDATHFVTDKFVRTRNMLESIAFGKPVVTHMWLESCGQASCLIDEKNYILRDMKKEREFGFSMLVSLARACQRPLLRGQRVLITPSTKPGKEILVSLVKAVQGLPVERIGRSALKDEKLPDDLLVLSCEEDYAYCVPFLQKGAIVYSSELLLNGIVIQKLEYERHRLFVEHVKKTRSTLWVKGDGSQFVPVTRVVTRRK